MQKVYENVENKGAIVLIKKEWEFIKMDNKMTLFLKEKAIYFKRTKIIKFPASRSSIIATSSPAHLFAIR